MNTHFTGRSTFIVIMAAVVAFILTILPVSHVDAISGITDPSQGISMTAGAAFPAQLSCVTKCTSTADLKVQSRSRPGVVSIITVPTIQAAINAARVGDIIKVLPGTYTEKITISKSLTFIGSGAKSTIIKAPAVLDNNVLGLTYIAQLNGGATVNMKGFTLDGTPSCEAFLGISVLNSATLNLDTSVITGCYQIGVLVGSTLTLEGHRQDTQLLHGQISMSIRTKE